LLQNIILQISKSMVLIAMDTTRQKFSLVFLDIMTSPKTQKNPTPERLVKCVALASETWMSKQSSRI
jgi:hypothetical protein